MFFRPVGHEVTIIKLLFLKVELALIPLSVYTVIKTVRIKIAGKWKKEIQ